MGVKFFVKNSENYWEFIRQLRNMDGVRQGFIQQEYINSDNHKIYMKKYGHLYYICTVEGTPAGYVGVIDNDIRVATHPDFQGQGVGTFMIENLMKIEPQAYAKVKVGNEASLRLFEKCGFTKQYYILEKNNETQSI